MTGIGVAASGGDPDQDPGRQVTDRRMSGGKAGGPWLALAVQSRRVSAAIGDADGVLARVDERDLPGAIEAAPSSAPTSRLALAVIDRALAEAGAGLKDLAGLCVADGPGPFTAIRVAMSLIQGIGVARRLPVIPVPSLAALAVTAALAPLTAACAGRPGGALVLTAVDARMGECYFGAWRVGLVDPASPGEPGGPALARVTRPVDLLPDGVGRGEQIRPAFEAVLARLAAGAEAEAATRPGPGPGTAHPLVMLVGSGFGVDPVLAGWQQAIAGRLGRQASPSSERIAGVDLVVDVDVEADASAVLAAALAPLPAEALGPLSTEGFAPPSTEVLAPPSTSARAPDLGASQWGPVVASALRPRYVRDKVALDVDEQRRLAAARDAASSRG